MEIAWHPTAGAGRGGSSLPAACRAAARRLPAKADALGKYSFRFTVCESVWGTSEYKWVPWNAFENFEQEYKRACETLAAAKAEVLAKYDDILVTLRQSFAGLAEDSAKRLDATLDIPVDREEFIANVVARAMGMIPSRETIRDGLTISLKPKVIVLGSEMIAEQQKARALNLEIAKIEAERQQVRLELDTRTRIEQLKINDFELEQKREREVKERIRQMKIEAAREAAQDAASPMKESLDQITARVFEAAREMAEKLQTADFVPGSLAKRARQMCEWYVLMNFTQDSSLEEVLQRLRDAAGTDAKFRSRSEMQSALSDVLRATSLQSKRLLDEDRLSVLDVRIRARYPLIAINTYEEDRVRECLKDLMCRDKHKEKPLYFWSRPSGLQKIYEQAGGILQNPQGVSDTEDPESVLQFIAEQKSGIFLLCDYAPYITPYAQEDAALVRRLREIA
jgi:hypothetical protein